MAKKFTTRELNTIINNYLNALDGKVSIQQAILFGSYAKGSAKDYSDIDLLIISNDLPKNKLKTSNGYFLDTIVGKVNPSLEVIGIHPENLDDDISQDFFEEIFKTGIIIKPQALNH